jgi:CHAD domain-containing protein/CYTH domain-containing protein
MISWMRLGDHVLDLSAEEGARVVALGFVAGARTAGEALAAGVGEEPLHDFRVAVRRLRSALRMFRPWLQGGDGIRPRHEKRLRRIGRSTNEARDAESQLAWLATKEDAVSSPRQRVGYERAVARFEAQARLGRESTGAAAERYPRAADRLERRLGTYERKVSADGEAGTSFAGALASLIGDQIAVLSERMNAIAGASDQETTHRARIEGKCLRYVLEPLRGHRGVDASEAIERLKRLQGLLGDLHDTHVLAGVLRELLADAAADRARQLHSAVYEHGAAGGARLGVPRANPLPGLLALVRLVRDRRDALYAQLEREWRAGEMKALAAGVRTLAVALEARAGGKVEHERRFLLAALPPKVADDHGVEIVLGWLPGSGVRERVRRVRGPDGERYWRALDRGSGAVRFGTEEETTRHVFDALWPLTDDRRIAKRRHSVHEGSRVWEIDAFVDRDLVVAGVALPVGARDVSLPDWLRPFVLRDVTDDPAYLDENLSATPGAPAPPELDAERLLTTGAIESSAPPAG